MWTATLAETKRKKTTQIMRTLWTRNVMWICIGPIGSKFVPYGFCDHPTTSWKKVRAIQLLCTQTKRRLMLEFRASQIYWFWTEGEEACIASTQATSLVKWESLSRFLFTVFICYSNMKETTSTVLVHWNELQSLSLLCSCTTKGSEPL